MVVVAGGDGQQEDVGADEEQKAAQEAFCEAIDLTKNSISELFLLVNSLKAIVVIDKVKRQHTHTTSHTHGQLVPRFSNSPLTPFQSLPHLFDTTHKH